MPRSLPPYCERWRDRHGKVRVYFRRGKGPRLPMPADVSPTSPEYIAALTGHASPRAGRAAAAADTIAALVVSYMRSGSYRDLRATTKAAYSTPLNTLRTVHGHRTVSGMTKEGILGRILQPYADRPGARLHVLKMLRILIRHAIAENWLRHDPTTGIKRPKLREIRSWSEAEIAQFEARWPVGTKQRLAFALMLYTGQRRSDVHRMTWADVNGTTIRVQQQKTGTKLVIPLHDALRRILSGTDRKHLTIVNTEYGKPFTVDGFSQWMRDAIRAAGLPLECQPHGLRKAAGRRLAEAQCTAHQIMAVLGHKSLAEAERYTRDAEQAPLAVSAIARLEGHKKNRIAQTAKTEFGKNSKRKGKSK